MNPGIKPQSGFGRSDLLVFAGCLIALMVFFFHRSFEPNTILFSNDGPLGACTAGYVQPPSSFVAEWNDLTSIGSSAGYYPVGISGILFWALGPVGFSKIYVPITLLFMGFGAWVFLSRLRLSPLACVLGALAIVLNSGLFSTTCWGVGPQIVAFGLNFLAMAAVISSFESPHRRWIKVCLAGFAVGMGVVEAADVGAYLSILTAMFVIFYSWARVEDGAGKLAGLVQGVGRLAVVTGCAVFIALHAVYVLVATQIAGTTASSHKADSAEQWSWATQWSLPKKETLGLFIPGLFGYRMDSQNGANYWGVVGSDLAWDTYFSAGAAKLQDSEILDPLGLASKLSRKADPVSAYLWDKFDSSAQSALKSAGGADAERLRQVLADNLNRIIENGPLYEDARFLTVKLRPETQELADADPGHGLRARLNRFLIEDAYPGQFRPLAARSPNPSPAQLRFTGGGAYAGVLVALMAVWAVFQAFRRKESPFTRTQRRLICFWLVMMIGGILFAWGRFAPFYQFLYALPYFSTIRNATKLLYFFAVGIWMLFAYGIHGLSLRCAATVEQDDTAGGRRGWADLAAFDRRWIAGSAVAVLAAAAGWMIYAKSRVQLEHYLWLLGFGNKNATDLATSIASFSIRQVGWFVLFLALSVTAVILFLTGTFSGPRAKWGAVLLGLILVVDLGLADVPWVKYWDYKQKYASNPVIDLMRDKPYEHRVAMLPFDSPPEFSQLYGIEWTQHHFLYYNIQSLDVIQMSRVASDWAAYRNALSFDGSSNTLFRVARLWQLTNTRYLLGPAPYIGALNQELDPGRGRFRFAALFTIVPKPGIDHPEGLEDVTAEMTTNGPLALFDFQGALPRVKLYSDWQVTTNDQYVLGQLGSQDFDPWKKVFVSGSDTPNPASAATNLDAGTVNFTDYAPRDIHFTADVKTPAVLLLNDKYDANWKVAVDGQPAPLLRCNYIMRGVYLQPGEHKVEFTFSPPLGTLYVSMFAIAVALGLLVMLVAPSRPVPQPDPVPVPEKPADSEPKAVAKK